MKKILISFFIFLLFLVTFVISFPKDRLFAFAQNQLQTKNIQLSTRELSSTLFTLELDDSSVAYENIKMLNIQQIKLSFLGIHMQNISSDGTFQTIFPKIKSIDIVLKTGDFLKIVSSIANAKGSIDLKSKTIKVIISPKSKEFLSYKMLLQKLKKEGDKYVFKYSF